MDIQSLRVGVDIAQEHQLSGCNLKVRGNIIEIEALARGLTWTLTGDDELQEGVMPRGEKEEIEVLPGSYKFRFNMEASE